MLKEAIERMVLRQCNFRAFSGLFTISNQFRVRALLHVSRPIYNFGSGRLS